MADNKNTVCIECENGTVTFANNVLAIIASIAINDVEGVASNQGSTLMDFFTNNKKTQGIKVNVAENSVSFDINISVYYGEKIHEVCAEVQSSVSKAIDNMTSLTVTNVNVIVQGINFKEEPKVEVEEEE